MRPSASQPRPSQARSSRIAAENSGRQRVVSMSSRRSQKRSARAQAVQAEKACPRCKNPVGLGAKREVMLMIVSRYNHGRQNEDIDAALWAAFSPQLNQTSHDNRLTCTG